MRVSTVVLAAIFASGGSAACAAPVNLISSARIPGAPAGAQAFRITYRSADEQGKPIAVTGAVIVPSGGARAKPRDIVVWTHGASGVAEGCGLSDKPGLFDQIAGLERLLAAGYVVVAPDYQGLGNPGPHPFLAGKAAANTVIDAARAARAVPRARTSARYAVFGESLGGFSALWAAASAERAPELTLAGVVAAAPPTDLRANLTGGTNAAVRAFLTAYTATSWEQVYGLRLTDVVRPRTATLIRRLATNCVTLDGFALRTKIGMLRLASQLKGVDLAASPRWSTLMVSNSVPASRVSVPVLVVQGSADVIVAPAVTRAFADRLCRRNRAVRYIQIEGGDHVSIGKRAAPDAVAWIGDRFAGKSERGNCPKA